MDPAVGARAVRALNDVRVFSRDRTAARRSRAARDTSSTSKLGPSTARAKRSPDAAIVVLATTSRSPVIDAARHRPRHARHQPRPEVSERPRDADRTGQRRRDRRPVTPRLRLPRMRSRSSPATPSWSTCRLRADRARTRSARARRDHAALLGRPRRDRGRARCPSARRARGERRLRAELRRGGRDARRRCSAR